MKRCPACQREFTDSYTFCDQDGTTLVAVLPEVRAHLTIHLADGSSREMTLPDKPLVIGKAPECDIVIPDGAISRRHAEIEARAGKVFIKDLKSLNGTRINDQKIGEQEVELKEGDSVSLGRTSISLRFAPPVDIESRPTAEEEIPPVRPTQPPPTSPPLPPPPPIQAAKTAPPEPKAPLRSMTNTRPCRATLICQHSGFDRQASWKSSVKNPKKDCWKKCSGCRSRFCWMADTN